MSDGATIYAIDTCSITKLKRVYPRPVFESVWTFVESLVASRRLISSEEVLEELRAFDDECLEWAERHKGIFIGTGARVQLEAKRIINQHPHLLDLKQPKSGADPFLIAVARIHGAVVITEEGKSGGPPKLKIPDVCAVEKLTCMPIVDLFKAERLRTR